MARFVVAVLAMSLVLAPASAQEDRIAGPPGLADWLSSEGWTVLRWEQADLTGDGHAEVVVLAVGTGCGSCRLQRLLVLDGAILLFDLTGDEPQLHPHPEGGFEIARPVRVDSEPLCCPTSYSSQRYVHVAEAGVFALTDAVDGSEGQPRAGDSETAAGPLYITRSGPRPEDVITHELAAAGYDGPWDIESMLEAYHRALRPASPVARPAPTPMPAPTSMPAPTATRAPAPTPQSAGNAARLADCLARSFPLPDPERLLPPDTTGPYRRRWRETYADTILMQSLLRSAGMYGNTPTDVRTAMEFFRPSASPLRVDDLQTLARLADTFEAVKHRSDLEISDNCGLVVLRRVIRAEPMFAGWLVSTAASAQAGLGREHIANVAFSAARGYDETPGSGLYPEGVLDWALRRAHFRR